MRVLVIDDDDNIRESFKWLLEKQGHDFFLCRNGEEAVAVAKEEKFDLAFCDVMMPGIGGLKALEQMMSDQPELKVIMISGEADISTAVKATKIGAYDFLEKPLNPERVILELKKLAKQLRLQAEMDKLKNIVENEYQLVGDSPKMQALKEMIQRAAPSDGRLLITGENGTGKELVARQVHKLSGRSGNFVQLNCAALPKELIESELFGYEKGAFTGANKRKIGLIEEAEGGTLLLDEIGDMAPETQAKVLRVLQESEFTRVGATKSQKFDVRIISATNKDLLAEIEKSTFREDLYFRLNVIPIHIPPLRERQMDIPDLVSYFLSMYGSKNGKRPLRLSAEAIQLLANYPWPGNIRELRNILERLSIMTQGDEIDASDVTNVLGLAVGTVSIPQKSSQPNKMPLKDQLAKFEAELLQSAFVDYHGNVSQLAVAMQTDRANLHKKLKKYGIK
jgi:two-component system, NtrC family, nitrogen regulation response regulator NtrX